MRTGEEETAIRPAADREALAVSSASAERPTRALGGTELAEGCSFLRDWTLFLALEATAVALFFAAHAVLNKRTSGKTVVFVRVEVFLNPVAFDSRLTGAAVLPANFFRTATTVGSAIRHLGGEVLVRPGVGRPLLARLPQRSLPRLVRSELVERVETAQAVAFEIGRRR